jgi:Zn finger protein HypA/HybF involved in hydrogenase expression
MSGSDNPSVIKCRDCGYTMDVPSGFHDDGRESPEGRTAKCPRCGSVNTGDSYSSLSLTMVKGHQILRHV